LKKSRAIAAVCVCLALAAIAIPIRQQMRRLELNRDLLAAIRQDRPDLVRHLLAQGANPNATGPVSAFSWRLFLESVFGRSRVSNATPSALGVAIGMNPNGDFEPNSAHCNPEVISTLLAHGAVLNPADLRDPWRGLKGWTLDNNGFGLAYDQHFGNSVGTGHVYFEKRSGITIISAFRKAGLKGG
jgi:hypothetical protein